MLPAAAQHWLTATYSLRYARTQVKVVRQPSTVSVTALGISRPSRISLTRCRSAPLIPLPCWRSMSSSLPAESLAVRVSVVPIR